MKIATREIEEKRPPRLPCKQANTVRKTPPEYGEVVRAGSGKPHFKG